MRKFLATTVALSGMLIAGAAWAQSGQSTMYTTGTGDNMMVMGGADGGAGTKVAASKDDCKAAGAAAYYKSGPNSVASCADDRMYDLAAPDAGAMNGDKPYEEGSMMMKEQGSK